MPYLLNVAIVLFSAWLPISTFCTASCDELRPGSPVVVYVTTPNAVRVLSASPGLTFVSAAREGDAAVLRYVVGDDARAGWQEVIVESEGLEARATVRVQGVGPVFVPWVTKG